MNRAHMARIDDSLIQVIRDVQRQFESINKQQIKFTQASRALAMLYNGIDIANPPSSRKRKNLFKRTCVF
jgi:hypothetical protein